MYRYVIVSLCQLFALLVWTEGSLAADLASRSTKSALHTHPVVTTGTRFIVDDEEFEDKVVAASRQLLRARKLVSAEKLQRQVHTKGMPIQFGAAATEPLTAPDICERLRASTFAIGSFYKCPDCGQWHFNSSAGFVTAPNGVICTSSHVVVAEDKDVKESYLVAADSEGHVYPVQSVLAADTEADTCFLQIAATGLQPLPFRSGIRPGEKVYCLSNPGGFHFMFTEGIVARVNRRRDVAVDAFGNTNGLMTRPMLYLNITAEFAPGSSGAAIVDESGNVVGQVSSISEAGEPERGDENNAPSPSVPIRFCIASEEIAGLSDPDLEKKAVARQTTSIPQRAAHMVSTNRPPRKP